MSRRSRHRGHEESSHGGDRPWVYFMVDCFFLVTQFFVITFKVKVEEVALPQRLPPGGTSAKAAPSVDQKKKLSIHVSGTTEVQYEFMSRTTDLAGLNDTLAAAVTSGQEYQVRVSYDAKTPFRHVMAVFNACNKAKIAECGLIPIRSQ